MADVAVKIRILSAGAPKLGVRRCAETFARRTGHEVDIEFATAPALRDRVEKGEAAADILVAPVPLIKECADAGHIVVGTGIVIGSVKAGIAVRDGAPLPDISSVEALKRALIAADAVIYNTASSGRHITTLLADMGIAEQIEAKTERLPTGAAVMVRLTEGKAMSEIAFGQITEIRRFGGGVTLVGPLPPEITKTTTYAATLLAGTVEPARALLAYMDTPEARQIYSESVLE